MYIKILPLSPSLLATNQYTTHSPIPHVLSHVPDHHHPHHSHHHHHHHVTPHHVPGARIQLLTPRCCFRIQLEQVILGTVQFVLEVVDRLDDSVIHTLLHPVHHSLDLVLHKPLDPAGYVQVLDRVIQV